MTESEMSHTAAPADRAALTFAIEQFLYHEAWLLDSSQMEAWVDLFSEQGVYWIPSSRTQSDMLNEVSIVLEDKALLRVRMQRLGHANAHAVIPMPATVHAVSNVQLINDSARASTELTVRSIVTLREQRNHQSRSLNGYATHTLVQTETGFNIVRKRVDLIQCGTAFAPISMLL